MNRNNVRSLEFVADSENHPPVEWHPEPYAALAARVDAAFVHCFSPRRIASGGIRPAELRENVFDFEDGLRLIMSREITMIQESRLYGVLLHASASIRRGSRLDSTLMSQTRTITKRGPPGRKALRDVRKMAKEAIKSVEKRLRSLTGRPFKMITSTVGGVMHFLHRPDTTDPFWEVDTADYEPEET